MLDPFPHASAPICRCPHFPSPPSTSHPILPSSHMGLSRRRTSSAWRRLSII